MASTYTATITTILDVLLSFFRTGVWFMHCHLERHLTWGMEMVFIVKDGHRPEDRLLPPPPDMPPC